MTRRPTLSMGENRYSNFFEAMAKDLTQDGPVSTSFHLRYEERIVLAATLKNLAAEWRKMSNTIDSGRPWPADGCACSPMQSCGRPGHE